MLYEKLVQLTGSKSGMVLSPPSWAPTVGVGTSLLGFVLLAGSFSSGKMVASLAVVLLVTGVYLMATARDSLETDGHWLVLKRAGRVRRQAPVRDVVDIRLSWFGTALVFGDGSAVTIPYHWRNAATLSTFLVRFLERRQQRRHGPVARTKLAVPAR